MTQATGSETDQRCLLHLLSRRYKEEWLLAELQREFSRKGFIELPGLLSESAFPFIKSEIERVEHFAKSKNLVMEGYETPRIMRTVRGSTMLQESPILWLFYLHYELRNFIARVTGGEVYPCLHPDEFITANYLVAPGATHGWHLDDPAYALTLVFEAPTPEEGGSLEFIPDWREFCAERQADPELHVDPLIEEARAEKRVRKVHLAAGEAYLLRADKSLHRVTELKVPGVRRVVLVPAYEATPYPRYGNTATLLYKED